MSDDLKRRLRAAAKKTGTWTAERDRLIVEARRQGATLREIAAVAGLSHTAVRKIIDRTEKR